MKLQLSAGDIQRRTARRSACIADLALVLMGILAIPLCVLLGVIALIWWGADRILESLHRRG